MRILTREVLSQEFSLASLNHVPTFFLISSIHLPPLLRLPTLAPKSLSPHSSFPRPQTLTTTGESGKGIDSGKVVGSGVEHSVGEICGHCAFEEVISLTGGTVETIHWSCYSIIIEIVIFQILFLFTLHLKSESGIRPTLVSLETVWAVICAGIEMELVKNLKFWGYIILYCL